MGLVAVEHPVCMEWLLGVPALLQVPPSAWDLQIPQGSVVRAESGSFLRAHLSTCFLLNTYYVPGMARDKAINQDRALPGELRWAFRWLLMLLRHSLHF